MNQNTNNKPGAFMAWQREIIRYFSPYLNPDRHFMFVLGLLNLVMIASNTLLIWKLGTAISLISNADFTNLNQTLLIIAGIVLFNQVMQFVYAFIYQRMTLRFVDRVRGEVLGRIMDLSFPIYNRLDKGDLLVRLTGNTDRILAYVVNIPLNLASSIVVFIVYSSMVVWIDWQLALIALLLAPLFFLSQYFVAPKTGAAARRFTEERANLVSIEEQTLSNLKGISSFNCEEIMRDKQRKQFGIARKLALKVRQIRLIYNSIFTILLYLAGVVLVYSGVSGIQSGRLTVGVFVSFLIYIRYLTNPVRTIAGIPIQFQANRAAAERVMEVMHMQRPTQDVGSDTPLVVSRGEIAFNDISFSYPNSTNPVYSHLFVAIHAGESVALVGPSGSGKSTFASLILRFFDPQSGNITIDGTDIKTVSLTSLRQQISIVWQEPLLINGSIRENLLLAKHDATSEQMIAACQSGFAWEFIENLEQGLDTVIGASGINLSVGQKQRLAIAQAFLRDTPILILDEASSALDSHSERMVVEALQALRQSRTTLIIAHRISSIRNADRILYFNGNGSITTGTHEELMDSHAAYKDAVNWQTSLN
jgi:ABC-type multidrug transport system fused ATPase/permease subunit